MSSSAWASRGAADEIGGESTAAAIAAEAWASIAGEIEGRPR